MPAPRLGGARAGTRSGWRRVFEPGERAEAPARAARCTATGSRGRWGVVVCGPWERADIGRCEEGRAVCACLVLESVRCTTAPLTAEPRAHMGAAPLPRPGYASSMGASALSDAIVTCLGAGNKRPLSGLCDRRAPGPGLDSREALWCGTVQRLSDAEWEACCEAVVCREDAAGSAECKAV